MRMWFGSTVELFVDSAVHREIELKSFSRVQRRKYDTIVNITQLICPLRGDTTMSFLCDHALKQFVHGFSSFHFDMAPRLASAPYLVELRSRELTYNLVGSRD